MSQDAVKLAKVQLRICNEYTDVACVLSRALLAAAEREKIYREALEWGSKHADNFTGKHLAEALKRGEAIK